MLAGGATRLAAHDWSDCDDAASALRWERLVARASEPNPFHEPWYLLPALRGLDPQGKVRLLVLESGGEWLGLLPVSRDRWYYRYPLPQLCNWVHGNCFLGTPLVAAGHERAFWQALLGWADRHAGTGLFVHLTKLGLEGPVAQALSQVLLEQGRTAAMVHREERALLQSGETPEAYLAASLSGKKRKELRRQFARLAEQGEVLLERRDDAQGLDVWCDAFLTLEAAGWKGKAGSALACDPATETLFRQALLGAARRGRLERLSLQLDSRPIAMLASFIGQPGAFSYKTAYDESLARFSPGVLLQLENLALLEREGVEWCDSCAAPDHPMIDHIWRQRRSLGRVSIAIGGAPRRALFRALVRLELGRHPEGIAP